MKNTAVKSVRRSATSTLERDTEKWERVTAQLADARTHQAQSEIACAEKIADGEDATEASAELQRAESAVKQLESAVALLWQRKEDAHAARINAERAVKLEAEAAQAACVLALGPRFEQLSGLLRQLAIDTDREIKALCLLGGNEKYACNVTETKGQFELFLGLAKHPLTNNGHMPDARMKYKTWSDCLAALCSASPRNGQL